MSKLSIVCIVVLGAAAAHAQTGVVQTMITAVSADSLMTYDRTLERAAGYFSRAAYTPGNDSSVQYILRTLKRNPEITQTGLDTFYVASAFPPYDQQPLYNVYGIIRGKTNPSTAVIIGAHLDSFSGKDTLWKTQWRTMHAPGADDNGTGVSTVLELGRIFGTGSSFDFAPDRTIILVAFNAEEAGMGYPLYLYGSTHFADYVKASGYSVAAMINIDMTGLNTALTMDVVSNDASLFIGEEAVALNAQYGLGLAMNAPPFVFATYSDHSSFWNDGFPAVLLIEHAPPNQTTATYAANITYHTTHDTSGALNPDLMKRSAQLALATAASFAVQPASGVRIASPALPASSELDQNYPNPFNPTTHIPFTVAAPQHVRITVYDVLGREAARLVDARMAPGTYAVDWNAADLPSGVYLAVFRTENADAGGANNFLQTKKLLLQK